MTRDPFASKCHDTAKQGFYEAESFRDASRFRWLLRMSANVGFDANPFFIDPRRIDDAIARQNVAYQTSAPTPPPEPTPR